MNVSFNSISNGFTVSINLSDISKENKVALLNRLIEETGLLVSLLDLETDTGASISETMDATLFKYLSE